MSQVQPLMSSTWDPESGSYLKRPTLRTPKVFHSFLLRTYMFFFLFLKHNIVSLVCLNSYWKNSKQRNYVLCQPHFVVKKIFLKFRNFCCSDFRGRLEEKLIQWPTLHKCSVSNLISSLNTLDTLILDEIPWGGNRVWTTTTSPFAPTKCLSEWNNSRWWKQ